MTTLKLTLKENIALLKPIIAKVYPESTIMQDLCLCQAILESRLISNPSGLALKYNNLFGIKKAGTSGLTYLMTWEVVRGEKKQLRQWFGWNLTLEDSIKQHRDIMKLKRYEDVWHSKDLEEAAERVRMCGYATDPSYTTKLIDIYHKYVKNA